MFSSSQQALFQQALSLHQRMKLDEAETIYRMLLAADADHADVLQLLGTLNYQRGNADAGIDLMKKSLALSPNQASVHMNLGNALGAARRYDEALASYRRSLVLNPSNAEAYYNLATLLYGMQQYQQALDSYDQAIRLKSDYADAFLNRGNVLKDLRRYDEALPSYLQAIKINPQCAEAFNNRGAVFEEVGRHDDAVASYRQAIALNPRYAEAFYNLGGALRKRRRYGEALDNYRRAFALKPDMEFLQGMCLHTKQHICDWAGLEAETRHLLAEIDEGKKRSSPFNLLATPATPAQQRRCATLYAESLCPRSATPVWSGAPYSHDKIRVGYFSSDFHSHATAHLIAELFECHDRERFEVVGFSWGPSGGPTAESAMRSRLKAAFDQFIDVQFQSDRDVAALAGRLEIDIAVDLKGFTNDSRPGIFAYRPAPVQVSYLGFPGTMGTDVIDYLIADPILIPAEQRPHYSEHIVYLPDTYQVNDTKREISAHHFTRNALGLPDSGFVYCCFNNNFKIAPAVFDIWMRLLRNVPSSVLWLLDGSPEAKANLQREAERRGVAADRLVFAPRMDTPDHLARHTHADLCLDTFFCNGHTTTSDALWAGVPVVTCLGETFAARVSGSLLTAIGLPELVAQSWQAYEALAHDLAVDRERLTALKTTLAANRATHPLFNTRRFARHLEAAYRQMHLCHHRGEAPDDIVVNMMPLP